MTISSSFRRWNKKSMNCEGDWKLSKRNMNREFWSSRPMSPLSGWVNCSFSYFMKCCTRYYNRSFIYRSELGTQQTSARCSNRDKSALVDELAAQNEKLSQQVQQVAYKYLNPSIVWTRSVMKILKKIEMISTSTGQQLESIAPLVQSNPTARRRRNQLEFFNSFR